MSAGATAGMRKQRSFRELEHAQTIFVLGLKRKRKSCDRCFFEMDEVSFLPSVSSEMIKELKFNTCLSERMAISTIQARLLDRDGIQQTLMLTPQILRFAQEAVTASRALMMGS